MLTKQNIPSQLQVMYNCDYLSWDTEKGVYYREICDEHIGVFTDYSNPITLDEFQSILADLEDDLIKEAALCNLDAFFGC